MQGCEAVVIQTTASHPYLDDGPLRATGPILSFKSSDRHYTISRAALTPPCGTKESSMMLMRGSKCSITVNASFIILLLVLCATAQTGHKAAAGEGLLERAIKGEARIIDLTQKLSP